MEKIELITGGFCKSFTLRFLYGVMFSQLLKESMQKFKDIEYLLKKTRPKDVKLILINFMHSKVSCLNRRVSDMTSFYIASYACSCPLLYFLVTDLQTVLLMFFFF